MLRYALAILIYTITYPALAGGITNDDRINCKDFLEKELVFVYKQGSMSLDFSMSNGRDIVTGRRKGVTYCHANVDTYVRIESGEFAGLDSVRFNTPVSFKFQYTDDGKLKPTVPHLTLVSSFAGLIASAHIAADRCEEIVASADESLPMRVMKLYIKNAETKSPKKCDRDWYHRLAGVIDAILTNLSDREVSYRQVMLATTMTAQGTASMLSGELPRKKPIVDLWVEAVNLAPNGKVVTD